MGSEGKFEFTLFADYFQLYIQDDGAKGDLSESWTPEAVHRLLALAPRTIGIGTVRNMNVPVQVEFAEHAPENDLAGWDQVNECTIETTSGRLVIAGCTDYFPDAARIELTPGTYRARVYYGNLKKLSADGLDSDHYRIVLWSAPPGPLLILKQRTTAGTV